MARGFKLQAAFTDFQSEGRTSDTGKKEGKPKPVHTLNGSALAIPSGIGCNFGKFLTG